MTVAQWVKAAISIPDSEQISDLNSWRHWLVNAVVTLIVIFTLPVYLLFILPVELHQGHLLLVGMELAMYAAGSINILTRGRTLFGTSAFWVLWLQALILPYYYYWGPGFAPTSWFVMSIVLCAVYYGTKPTLFSVVTNIILLTILIAWIRPQSPGWMEFYGNPYIRWPGYLAILSWITLVSGVAVGFSLDRMDRTLKRERQSRIRFQESEARFRGLFDSNPNGIIVSDMGGRIQGANKAFLKTVGFGREELVGRSFTDMILEDQLEALEQRLASLKAGIAGDSPYELTYRNRDGVLSYALASAWLVTDEKSDPVAIGIHFRDISTEKNLLKEKSFLETQLQQAQKMEAIGTLAGGIAHDFNNILSGVLGYAELAQMELSTTQLKSKEYAAHILTAGRRARDLVRQILLFSRQEKSCKGPLSVTVVVKEVIKLLQSTLPSTIKIDARVAKDSLMIMADATQVHQVVMNLCTNGYQSMRDKHGTLGIVLEKVQLEREKKFLSMSIAPGEYVRLTVSDTGDGIGPDVIEKIFDPYFTTKRTGDGTGLGLSVSIGVVNEHGGLIEVHSELQHGSSFSVYLPFEPKSPQIVQKNDTYLRSGNNERILVVDDERFLLEVVAEHLTGLGYGVEIFTGSMAALQRFQEVPENFNLVITDQTMPEMTGLQLISAIRHIRSDIPFILCTGYSDQVTENRLDQLGNVDMLLKPVSRQELSSSVFNSLKKN